MRYRFGPFELDPEAGTLTRSGNRVKLQDLPYRLLQMVVAQPGQIVSRDAVRQRLWPDDTFVEFDNSLGVAVRKIREALGDDADSPRYFETVPRKGYRFVAPVTRTGIDTAAPADSPTPVASRTRDTRKTSSLPRRAKAYWAVPLIGLAAVAFAVVAFRSLKGRVEHVPKKAVTQTAVRIRRAVAVIGFRNLPGKPEDAWLSSAFAEMLSTELAADGHLRLVSGEDVARARRELPLDNEESLAKSTLARLRKDPGADVVVLGSYTPLSGKGSKRLRLDVRLQDTESGETIVEQAFVGNEDDLFELVSQVGATLRQNLGGAAVSGEIFAQTRAALPRSPLAIKLYTEGLQRLWGFEFVNARQLFIQAASVEPDFPLTHEALSETWGHLGYSLKARDEAERARSLSGPLGLEDRLRIDGQYYSSRDDTGKAIEVYQQLFSRFPDNLYYGIRLAYQQRWIDPEGALRTLATLKQLPSPASDDPRLDILEAHILIERDSAGAQAAARRAIVKGNAQGSRLLVAFAYGVLCQTMGGGGSVEETIHDCENARQSYAAAGDRNNAARTTSDFGGLYYAMGDLDKAQKMFREAISVFREVGDIQGVSAASGNLGDVFLAKGDLDNAERTLSGALPGYQEIGDKDGLALTLNDLGDIARLRGNLSEAEKQYERAKALALEIDSKRAIAYVMTGLGDVLFDRGDLAGAQKRYEDSLALRKQIGNKQTVAESELSLARLAVEQGRAADAEGVIRKCAEQFHQDQQADDELSASIALIEALHAQLKFSDVANAVKQTAPFARKSVNLLLRLRFDLASARAKSASGDSNSAKLSMEKILQSAQAHKLLGLELQTRLALAEIEAGSSRPNLAHSSLQELEQKAHNSGFELIAAKAQGFSRHNLE